jgi:hypothetical protein
LCQIHSINNLTQNYKPTTKPICVQVQLSGQSFKELIAVLCYC